MSETTASQFIGLEGEGCDACGGTGYHGRFVLVEMLTAERTELGRAILSRSDAAALEQLAVEAGMVTRWQRALEAVRGGRTSPAEIRRVLGVSEPPGGEPRANGEPRPSK